MADKIDTIDGAKIQHGPLNNRIYVMRLDPAETGRLIGALDTMARENDYGKIFAKIPATRWNEFRLAGYIREAAVPALFNGKTDGYFIAKYMSPHRQGDARVNAFRPPEKIRQKPRRQNPRRYAVEPCTPKDAAAMSAVFRQTFATYPFPIQEAAYLKMMMAEGVRYFCIRAENTIAALAAMEIDANHGNCEMTDFATLPPWRGKGFAGHLLDYMDKAAASAGIKTAYTIARAGSPGMNVVFNRRAYRFGGVLINNSQICGSIQNMSVWYKHL
jgi:putative beta-lysine N-acetyltransferase